MTDGLTLFFIFCSLLTFFYGMIKKVYVLNSILIAISLNIFPFILFGYLGMDANRFNGIPLAYIPFLASILAAISVTKFSFLKKDKNIIVLFIIFIFYIFFQSIFQVNEYMSFIVYFLMWIINIIAMLSFSKLISEIQIHKIFNFIKMLINILVIGMVIGIMKFTVGIQLDSNPFSLINRNGAVFLIVITTPLIFLLKDFNKINNYKFFLHLFIYGISILLIQSRMGLFGFIFAICIYYFNKSKFKITSLFKLFIMFILILFFIFYTPIGEKMLPRIEKTLISIQLLYDHQEFTANTPDYARIELMRYGINIIKENPIFGTGVGIENYQNELRRINPNAIRESKSHNFYISYPAELGIIGFFILMSLLFVIFKRFKNPRINSQEMKMFSLTFVSIFLSIMFMFTMNEYITFPIMWIIFGLGLGMLNKNSPLLNKN